MVAFVSVDTFLSGSEIYTSIEAMRDFRLVSFETYPHDVFLQTYLVGNYVLEYFKKDNEFGFVATEINFRKTLNYPPFTNLIELKFESMPDIKSLRDLLKQANILGPAKKFENKKQFFEVSLKTKETPKEIYTKLISSGFTKKTIGIRVFLSLQYYNFVNFYCEPSTAITSIIFPSLEIVRVTLFPGELFLTA